MKNLMFSLGLFAAMLVGIFFINSELKKIDMELIQSTEQIEKTVDNKDWKKASQQCEDLINHWQRHLKFVTFFINHNDTDAITYEMVRLKGYIKNEVTDECSPSVESIQMLFNKIIKLEEISLQDIF